MAVLLLYILTATGDHDKKKSRAADVQSTYTVMP